MLTKERISQFYKDVDALKLRFPVAELHRITGFSKGQISQVLGKTLSPSEDLIKEFYKGLNKVQEPESVLVYERIIEEKEARRIEAKEWAERAEKEKDRYLRIIEENLTQLLKVALSITSNLSEVKQDTSLGLSYQRAWVEYTAEEVAQGDKKKKDQTVLRMNKLLRSQIDRDQKAGNSTDAHKQSKEGN